MTAREPGQSQLTMSLSPEARYLPAELSQVRGDSLTPRDCPACSGRLKVLLSVGPLAGSTGSGYLHKSGDCRQIIIVTEKNNVLSIILT